MEMLVTSETKQDLETQNLQSNSDKDQDIIAAARKANSGHAVKAGSLDAFAMNGFPKRPPKLFW